MSEQQLKQKQQISVLEKENTDLPKKNELQELQVWETWGEIRQTE